jgi:hypothetical protein
LGSPVYGCPPGGWNVSPGSCGYGDVFPSPVFRSSPASPAKVILMGSHFSFLASDILPSSV